MLCWGGRVKETAITTTMQPDLFKRGDRVQISGFVNNLNGLFVVRRAKGTQYLMEPADGWDYITHYVTKLWQWVRWHYYGMIDAVEDKWNRLRKK